MPHRPHAAAPVASSATVSVPADDASARDTVVDKSAADDAADNHPAAGGDNLVTGDGAHADSADSENDAADKEDNASATTFQLTLGARYWGALGTTTRTQPGVAHGDTTRIRPAQLFPPAPGATPSRIVAV